MCADRHMKRSALALIVAASVLAPAKPAAAEEAAPAAANEPQPADKAAATQRVFIYTGYGVAAVGLGLSFVFLAKASSAFHDRQDIARQNGSDGQAVWRCNGADECRRMSDLRDEQTNAKAWWAAMTGVAAGGAIAGTTFLIAHLLDTPSAKHAGRPRLTPVVSHQEAGLQLYGSF